MLHDIGTEFIKLDLTIPGLAEGSYGPWKSKIIFVPSCHSSSTYLSSIVKGVSVPLNLRLLYVARMQQEYGSLEVRI